MKTEYLLTTLVALLLFNCEPEKPLEIISEKSPFGDFYMQVDTVSIPIGPDQTFIYPLFGTISENDSLYFLGYNRIKHSIDIFNLTAEDYQTRVDLEKEGPNGIPDVISFTPVTLDSLYIMSSYRISLVNTTGEILDKISINTSASNVKGHDSQEAFFWIEKDEAIHFSAKRKTLYGLYHSMEYGTCDKRRYQSDQLVSAIDLKENKMSFLPVSYPADKREKSYGFMPALFMTWDHDSLLYNFRHDPNIYLYDLNRHETTIFDGRSQYTRNSADPMEWSECGDVSKKSNQSLQSVNFEGVIRDPYRKLYYRFHRKELPATSNPNDYIFSDKKLFLTIFDNGLAKTGEMILDSRPYPSRVSFPTEKGLYVAAPSGENTLSFHVFKVFLTEGNSTEYGTIID
jgi:hypothetical protein